MTRSLNPPPKSPRPPGRWALHRVGAAVRSEGPQRVTVHGRDEVVVVSAQEFRRLEGECTGEALIAAMQASPYPEFTIEPMRDRMPVRGVTL